jgi:hypothetical protein
VAGYLRSVRDAGYYGGEAARLPAADFKARHGRWFLLRTPDGLDDSWDEQIEFVTTYQAMPSLLTGGGRMTALGVRVVPIVKRPENPFPDRVSVGRSRTSDIPLRIPYVSKLHAHFLIKPDGTLALVDQHSANGTTLEGRKLAGGKPVDVRSGQRISFGGYELQFVEVGELLRKLRM